MLKIYILIIGLMISLLVSGQVSFEVEYGTNDDDFLRYTFETSTGDIISLGGQKDFPFLVPEPTLILKINNSGEITNELVYFKPDTNFFLRYGFEKANGNFLLFGTMTDSVTPDDFNITYVCERTPELTLVWEKFLSIPEPYRHHSIDNFIIDADSMLIIMGSADSSLEGYDDDVLLTMKFDKYGNQLSMNFYEGWENPSSYNEMIFNKDSTAIYFFGIFTTGLSYLIEFIEMDIELNISDYISIIDWDHFSSNPITVKGLPDDNFVQANHTSMEPGAYHDLYVKIMDEEFNTLRDTLMLYPEYVYIPVYEGMGFIDPNQIWVSTFQPEFNSSLGTEIFRFNIFDSNLNLTGMKVYGGDRRYTFFNMLVTSDGGCLMTGTVPDYNGSPNDNCYIIKVMPEDIITNAEDTPMSNDKDVSVNPNPFDSEIRLQSVRENLTFELYDLTGKKILSGDINDHTESKISTETLSQGIFLYTIHDDAGIIQSGKLIKE
jgi:hypothetical protein